MAKKVEQEWKNNIKRLEKMRAKIGSNNLNCGGKFPSVVIKDLKGNLIGDFNHLQEASDCIQFTKSYIRACTLGKKKSKKYIIKIK